LVESHFTSAKNGLLTRMVTTKICRYLFCSDDILLWLNRIGFDNLCCNHRQRIRTK